MAVPQVLNFANLQRSVSVERMFKFIAVGWSVNNDFEGTHIKFQRPSLTPDILKRWFCKCLDVATENPTVRISRNSMEESGHSQYSYDITV